MGCHRITYDAGEELTPFLGVWKGERYKKSSFYFQGYLTKKGASLKKCDYYYPFGMNINALSSTAPLSKPNQFKFNGIEEVTDFDLNTYSAFYREYDPALGRWWQVDPKTSERESPYVGMGNSPIMYQDYLGDTIRGADGAPVSYAVNNEGQAVWSSNATEDVKRIGNAMLYTETGTKQLNALMSSETSITMEISEELIITKKGKYRKGITQIDPRDVSKDENGDYKISKAHIIIYEGTLKNRLSEKGNTDYYRALNTIDKAISGTASHESVHATDQENINGVMKRVFNRVPFDSEKKPTAVQVQVAVETRRKDYKKKKNGN